METKTKTKKRPFDTLRTVYSNVKIPWILALISLAASFLTANAMIGTAVITAKVVDSNGNLNSTDLWKYIGLLIGSGALACIGSFANSVLSERINIGVRTKLWKKILKLPMRFYDKESGETLVSSCSPCPICRLRTRSAPIAASTRRRAPPPSFSLLSRAFSGTTRTGKYGGKHERQAHRL